MLRPLGARCWHNKQTKKKTITFKDSYIDWISKHLFECLFKSFFKNKVVS